MESLRREAGAPALTAEVLTQALPYIQRFRGRSIVVKLGGAAMAGEMVDTFAGDVALLASVGIRLVVVHGGGPQIGEMMERFGKSARFVDGRRVTDSETLEIARMVLVGKINSGIVAAVNRHGSLAVGVSGEDARLIKAVQRDPSLGFVGEVAEVNTDVLERLLSMGLIPVVSSIGAGVDGQSYNINADTVAGALAAALRAERLIVLSDVGGLLGDIDDPASVLSEVSVSDLETSLASGEVSEGMIPKVEACLAALDGGTGSAHLLDGRQPHVLLLELFTDTGVGTMIRTEAPA